MYGDVVLLGRRREGEGVVLPDRDLRATEEDVLTSTRRGVLLLNLDLADVAGVVDDLGHVGLVSSTHLTRNAFGKVGKSAVHPILPEDTNAVAEGRKVRLDHAEGTVDGPEHEEDDEHVVGVPEALEVGAARLLSSSNGDGHQSKQHDIATPSGSGSKVGEDEAHKAKFVECSETGKVVPMSDSVNPGEEYDGPCDQLVECDVLVEGNDIVKGCATSHGDEVPADGEQDEGYVNM